MLPQQLSFKHVIEHFLSFKNYTVEKTYQLFNWRLRPLPSDAINYARDDSRLLLECCQKFKFVHVEFIYLKSYIYPIMQDYNFDFNRAWQNSGNNLKEKFVSNDNDF